MDGYSRDGPYTIKDVYKKFGQRKVCAEAQPPALTAPDKVIKDRMKDTTRDDAIYFFILEIQWSECNGPGSDSCIQRSESVRSMWGCACIRRPGRSRRGLLRLPTVGELSGLLRPVPYHSHHWTRWNI